MGLDVLFIALSLAGIILNILNGTLGALVIWAAILIYAALNLLEHRLKGSKYDY